VTSGDTTKQGLTPSDSEQTREARRVMIVGAHPHKGERGTVRDDLPMKMGMWEIELDPNVSATAGCFAGPEHLRWLRPEEDPYA
jgi:hypothetical protein